MPGLPPEMWAELHYDGAWNPARGLRATSTVTITRGLSAESASDAEPMQCECELNSPDGLYAPLNWRSPLYGKIGRNTPFRYGYYTGSPWAEMDGGLTYNSLFVNDNAALDVAGDFDMRVEVALEDWSESQMLALRYVTTGDNRSWALEILDGTPTFLWSPDGTLASRIDQAATEAVRGYNGQRLALRVTLDIDNGAGGYELRFYTGRTVDDEEWNLLGDPITGGATTSVYTGSAYMEIGAGFSFNSTPAGGGLNRLRGNAYALKLLDGAAVKVSMSTRSATPGGTTFTDDTGLTWSRGGTAVLTNKHIRMAGEVPSWPPTRDLSGNATHVSINPTGVTRRMDAGNKPQDSALLRFIRANSPIECWPLADGEQATSGKALNGSKDMTVTLDSGSTQPLWGRGSVADWLEPVVQLPSGSDGTMRGEVAVAAAAATGWSVDFFYAGKQSVDVLIADSGDLTVADPRVGWNIALTASADQITLTTVSATESTSSSTLQATVSSAGVVDGALHHVRLTTSVSGSNALYTLYVDGESAASGTATGYASEALYFIRPGWFYASVTESLPSIGYVTYWGSSDAPSAAEMWDAANGFRGERAGTRIERLGAESGYTASAAGETSYQVQMGRQRPRTLRQLLDEASVSNFGYFLDARDRLEVIHRGNSTLWNQPPALTLDFRSGVISSPFRPVDDDRLTRNDVTVKSIDGYISVQYVDETTSMSVLDPPDGVGRYDVSYDYSLYQDYQANQTAHLLRHLGTYPGVRYARITLDLANERVFRMIDDILRADAGDKIRLTSLPLDHGPDDVDVLIHGYTEEAGPESWKITFNCVPAQPWTAAVLESDQYGILDTDGCELAEDLDETETGVDVTTTSGPRWADSATYPTDYPLYLRVDAEVMQAVACTGTTTSQTFTVIRSINGVTTTHPAGADIRVAYPVYAAL